MPHRKRTTGLLEEPVPPGISPKDYNAFIAKLDLESIRLARLEITALHAYAAGRPLIPFISTDRTEYVGAEQAFVVSCDLRFEGRYEDEAEPVISVAARFEIGYNADRPMTDAIFTIFKQTSLQLNTWPYFRELVQSSLARAGWPVLVLPVYRDSGQPPL